MKTFEQLYAELAERAAYRPEGSSARSRRSTPASTRSARRSSRRPPRPGWRPSTRGERAAEEIAQLLYHAQVLMVACGLTLDDVYAHGC